MESVDGGSIECAIWRVGKYTLLVADMETFTYVALRVRYIVKRKAPSVAKLKRFQWTRSIRR